MSLKNYLDMFVNNDLNDNINENKGEFDMSFGKTTHNEDEQTKTKIISIIDLKNNDEISQKLITDNLDAGKAVIFNTSKMVNLQELLFASLIKGYILRMHGSLNKIADHVFVALPDTFEFSNMTASIEKATDPNNAHQDSNNDQYLQKENHNSFNPKDIAKFDQKANNDMEFPDNEPKVEEIKPKRRRSRTTK